mmetsp:Transcript_51509/g.95290  ORF Transcript_51509/g.95290 Transcript_51509/m.95290 type:complete len:220 (-) Transcript_51509:144-803(-)
MAPKLRLHWWDFPGRGAEPTRLALTLKGIPFDDVRYPRSKPETAADIRARSPFGFIPCLEIDDVVITESTTIMRYVGRLCGYMPDDPVEAAKVDQVLDFITQDLEPLAGRGLEERHAAAKPGSPFHERMALLDVHLGKLDPSAPLNMADIKVFCETVAFISGFYDGFPTTPTFYSPYPNIQKVWHRMAAVPGVKAFYAGRTGFYAAFDAALEVVTIIYV